MAKESMSVTRPGSECFVWRFGDIELDEAGPSLAVQGAAVVIEPRPLALLMYLLRRSGEVCTKTELLEALWPGRVVTEGSLTNCVAKLRQALSDQDQRVIRTVHGYGYRIGIPAQVEAIEAPIPTSALQFEADTPIPRRSGWLLIRQLGTGSSGEVWLGRGKTGEQRVFKFGQRPESLASLKREVTLSRLLHDALGDRPDWVRVLDWNFDEPPYYVETEYCAAGNLGSWLAEQSSWPSMDMRIAWLAQIADALAAAHALGVLHKDLKPSNLLVADDGAGAIRLKIGDWGSGHVVDIDRVLSSRITRLGFTRSVADGDGSGGTPMYQAPEVIAGQPATIQADLYALGVLLYQLVIGDLQRPLAPGWERDIDDALIREDIALVADGNPAQRLADAAELARRLRGLSERRAERARLQAERLRDERQALALQRWQARRRWVFATGVLLVAGLVSSLFLYQRAERNAIEAREQARVAQATEAFLLKVFYANDRARADRPIQELSAKALLDANVDRLATDLANQPAVQLRLLAAAAKIYVQWNDAERLRSINSRTITLNETLYGPADARTLEAILATVNEDVDAGRRDAATETLDEVERRIVTHRLQGSLVHAHLLYHRSYSLVRPEGGTQAIDLLRQAIAIIDRLAPPVEARHAIMHNDLAAGLADAGELETARDERLRAIQLSEALPAGLRDDGLTGALYGMLADDYLLIGDADGADAAFTKSQEMIDKTYGPTYPDGWDVRAIHAEFLHRRGDRQRALAMFEEVMKRIASAPEEARVGANVRQRYAGCLIAEGRPALAIPLLEAAVPIWRDIEHSPWRLAQVQDLLGRAYGANGESRKARAILKSNHDKGPAGAHDHYQWLIIRHRWAEQLMREQAWQEAEVEFEAIRRDAGREQPRLVADAESGLARIALIRGDLANAQRLSLHSLQSLEQVRDFYDVRIQPRLWRVRAAVMARTGDKQGAEQLCARAISASRQYDDPNSPTVLGSCP